MALLSTVKTVLSFSILLHKDSKRNELIWPLRENFCQNRTPCSAYTLLLLWLEIQHLFSLAAYIGSMNVSGFLSGQMMTSCWPFLHKIEARAHLPEVGLAS